MTCYSKSHEHESLKKTALTKGDIKVELEQYECVSSGKTAQQSKYFTFWTAAVFTQAST